MQSESSVVVDGKFVPSAVVTVIADDKLTADSMIEMQAGVFAAFRCVCVCACVFVCVCGVSVSVSLSVYVSVSVSVCVCDCACLCVRLCVCVCVCVYCSRAGKA